jgi:hypothetical protein
VPIAYNLTRREIHYRHDAFSAGLRTAGFEVRSDYSSGGGTGNVLLIWNRYGQYHEIATRFEKTGGTVVVAENGYLGPGGISPHSMDPRTVYALAIGGHNGSGHISEGGPERWHALGVELKPWREDGGHVLVCPNRSFGQPGFIMPSDWANEICARLAKLTKREIRLRPHPGNSPPGKPLAEDLAGAWACVIWQSSAGVHSLVAGVPVICLSPAWICKAAADSHLECVEKVDDRGGLQPREQAMQQLAWGQWHLSEIEDGTAFTHLLRRAGKKEITACA